MPQGTKVHILARNAIQLLGYLVYYVV